MTLFLLSLFGCAPGTGLLAIGDSVFDWNTDDDQSIPAVAALDLGLDFQNNAVAGSLLTGEIPELYEEGDWTWVLVDGGANDLNERCACGDCDDLLDEMIAADGSSGIMADLVERITGDGHQVALMGYYRVPENAPEFTNCEVASGELNSRYEGLAAQYDSVIYVASSDVMTPDQIELYDEDLIHPSVEGSRVVGEYIAEQMRRSE